MIFETAIHGGAVSGGTFCLGEKFLLKILMDEGKVEWQFSTTWFFSIYAEFPWALPSECSLVVCIRPSMYLLKVIYTKKYKNFVCSGTQNEFCVP